MVNYPNGTRKNWNAAASGAGGRGMNLEKDINQTNQYYLNCDTAVIHKKPTPVTIVKVDYPSRSAAKITEAYFKVPSTTDYNGIYRGRYIDFEAKECSLKTSFPLKSIHLHQIKHLEACMRHGAVAFLIIRFTHLDETYLIPADRIVSFWYHHDRSSIPHSWFIENGYRVEGNYIKPVDYLKVVDRIYFEKGGSTSDGEY
ncbi:MAG: Holliday junction resolvase RecU [Solobacterium sp.]|nr:Holliday junction resolvase RecU [Solobacterium sp.]